ncbi:MAG: hypothetical protein WDN26_12865 [Chitinophagaceae bacterium]
MNSAVNELVRSITGKNSLGECGVPELKQIAAQFPYFGPAQLLLAQKLKEEYSPLYENYFQKASFYSQNSLWLDLVVNGSGSNTTFILPSPVNYLSQEPQKIETPPSEKTIAEPINREDFLEDEIEEEQFNNGGREPIDETAISSTEEIIEPSTNQPSVDEEMIAQHDEPFIDQSLEPQSITEEKETDTFSYEHGSITPVVEKEVIEPLADQLPVENETIVHTDESLTEEQLQTITEEKETDVSSHEPEITTPVVEEETIEESTGQSPIEEETIVQHDEPFIEQPSGTQIITEEKDNFLFAGESQAASLEPEHTGNVEEIIQATPEPEINTEEEIAIAENEQHPPPILPQFKFEPVKDSDNALTFEPFHTVDYFASLGIRSRDEEKPKDKFSEQLKSFTDWLKTLKRLPDNTSNTAPEMADQKVTQLAERSLDDRNIETEAMADVWEKQGNAEKAIEIYNKLSLSNPGKSSYFAAKIEQLKNS